MPLFNPANISITLPRGRSESSSTTAIAVSTTSSVLLAANTNRQSATFFNTATSRLFLNLGATAATTAYTAYLEPGGYFELPTAYTGVVSGLWVAADANGRCMVTELVDAID